MLTPSLHSCPCPLLTCSPPLWGACLWSAYWVRGGHGVDGTAGWGRGRGSTAGWGGEAQVVQYGGGLALAVVLCSGVLGGGAVNELGGRYLTLYPLT